jgi:hypothetical protein
VIAAAPERPADDGPDALALAVGPRLIYRRLVYQGAPPGQLAGLDTGTPAQALGVDGAWFPLWGLGLAAAFEQARSTHARTPTGGYRSSSRDVQAALAWRRAGARLDVMVDVGYGQHRSAFVPDQPERRQPPPLPDVSYTHLRPGLALRARAGRLAIATGVHYRHVLSAGAVTARDWFPGARARGMDAGLGLAWRLGRHLDVAMGLDARLYRLDFTAGTSVRLATAATDAYYAGWARLGFRVGAAGR